MRVFPGKRTGMSIQKQPKNFIRQEEEVEKDLPQAGRVSLPLHLLRQSLNTGLQGVNTVVQTFTLLVNGTQGGNLWTLNLSTRPSQQKRLLSISGCNLALVNYGIDSFPMRLSLVVNEVTPTYDQSGQPSHVVAVMGLNSPPITVPNSGVMGFNVLYSKLGDIPPVDITGIPAITFDLISENMAQPTVYPLSSPVAIVLQITHVML